MVNVRRKRKDDGSARRIVEVALELFATHGFHSVSTTQIAKAAAISQPSIHYHFKNKEALWKAAMEELGCRVTASSERYLTDLVVDEGNALSALKSAAFGLHRVTIDVPELGKVLFLEGQAGGGRLDWLMQNIFGERYSRFLELIEQCIKAKQIKPYRPHQILMIMHGAAVTYYNLSPLVQSTFDRDAMDDKNQRDFADAYMDVIFAGLKV